MAGEVYECDHLWRWRYACESHFDENNPEFTRHTVVFRTRSAELVLGCELCVQKNFLNGFVVEQMPGTLQICFGRPEGGKMLGTVGGRGRGTHFSSLRNVVCRVVGAEHGVIQDRTTAVQLHDTAEPSMRISTAARR